MGITIIERGGNRKRAGRKPQGMEQTCVSLDKETKRILTELGGGELSPGIRMAAQRVARLKPLGTLNAMQIEALFPGVEAWGESIAVWYQQEEQHE